MDIIKKNKKIVIVIILAAIILSAVIISVFISNNDITDYDEELKKYGYEGHDVQEYYDKNATVRSVVPINDAKDIRTEKGVEDDMKDRGFEQSPIVFSFSMKGDYRESQETSGSARTKSPVYETYFVSESEVLWTISSINGNVTAYPASYNIEREDQAEVLFSETETVFSYDNIQNVYYETVPNKEIVDLRVIERIDAETLNAIKLGGEDEE